ncbi:hypothetical protein H0H81_010378 [Sphagnurus paluster]|uniref:Uncharacterized protein n=1 Tax=Sphagnurus paluster TaxID=117069 RepID=A0A9P7K592_9AGAR|nr:hypothetical protein H0H81_010378 [Sphagnurus paluster]
MSDIEYAPPRVLSHPQHPPRQVHPSMSMSQHPRHSQQHQHPVSSDRLGPMHQDKKPRLGIAPSPGLAYSRSSSDDHIPSAISPISTARSGRYHHSNGHDSMVRSSYGVPPPYMPSHSSHSNHHPSSSVHHNSHGHHSHNQPPPPQHQRHSNQQYPPFFPTSGPGVGGPHYGDSPPSPSFIPLPSNGDYDTSSRGRSTNAGFPPPRNVYSSYSGDGGPSGGSGGGGSGDLFAAFMDAEHQARTTSIARRSSMSSSAAFGLEWPVHMNSDVPDSHPKSSGSHSGSGSSERDLGDRGGSAGSSAGGNGGGPGGADWLEFLAGNSGNVAAAG